ncbi:receptor-like protein kinase THESEUS 1 [Senna tora]|uniref:Receptor-like protein kinase THESEUS 1 n=1 Tax=Senna tora TaxID=362788 RepID=A0A834WU96_9FABA|nr:receptor-like protein kinase THESEUS 1 [Senna tora]
MRFLLQDLLQRDDNTERSGATRRRRREIFSVAMDPPSMVRVFAADESVSEVEREREKRPINLLGAREEPVENPNSVEQEISLTYLQTKHFLFRDGGGFFSYTLPKHVCVFSGKICCNETMSPRDLSGGQGSSFDGRTFIANSQHSTVRFQSQSSVIATINSSSISPIYQSTRIFIAQDKNLWKILNRVEQEISLTDLQTKNFLFRGGGGFFSFSKIWCNETTAPRDLFGGHGSTFDGESFCRR